MALTRKDEISGLDVCLVSTPPISVGEYPLQSITRRKGRGSSSVHMMYTGFGGGGWVNTNGDEGSGL